MAYDNQLKADTEIFEKIRFIPVGDEIILKPIMSELLDEEAMFYLVNTKTEGVKKYLPSVYAENQEQAKQKLLDFMQRMLLRGSLFYCIRDARAPFPLGYIHINSPLTPTGLDSWTVDFWLGNNSQGNGLMAASLWHLLSYLQKYQVQEVKALVHADNIKSVNVLKKVGFAFLHQETGGEKRFLYMIKLN